MTRKSILPGCLFSVLCLCLSRDAAGYLGSFEEADGYHSPFTTGGGYISSGGGSGMIVTGSIAGDANFFLNNNPGDGFIGWVPQGVLPQTVADTSHGPDVTRYNAGQFGSNAGGPGGIAVDIRDDTGLWTAVSGGRLDEDLNAPIYNGSISGPGRDYAIAYRYTNSRSGMQVLDILATEVDSIYDYTLDSRDFGQTPSSTNNNQVTMSFWFCPADTDDTYAQNTLGLGVWDTQGQRLVEVGYRGDNMLQYRVGSSSLWQTTSVAVGSFGWSQFVISLDTTSDTVNVSALAWDDNTSTLGNSQTLLATTGIGLDSQALHKLRWSTEGGVFDEGTGDAAYKNFFDDFQFAVAVVPEPGSALLAGVALALIGTRRRRSEFRR